MSSSHYDVVVIGAGHNGLVAASYLAKAGKRVLVLESNNEIGGATQSTRVFPQFDAKLSQYSYLVSLLPDAIVKDLGLSFSCISREVSSYTPYQNQGVDKGLFISRSWDDATYSSFTQIDPEGNEAIAWQKFYGEIAEFAQRIAPTMMQPLKTRNQLKELIALPDVWNYLIEHPIGEEICKRFNNDIVRGVILTDALIGTFASAFDMQANICFLYHLIGNGTGEWKVPVGGMGALTAELHRVAIELGVVIQTNSKVVKVNSESEIIEVTTQSGQSFTSNYLLSNAAPAILAELTNTPKPKSLDGSQIKINILLKRLPQLKSGIDPRQAFAGTFHINESFSQLENAYGEANDSRMPLVLPLEMYCHTLSDPSILSEELQRRGYQTLTIFGLHTPASLFDLDNEGARAQVFELALASLNQYLAEPIEDVIEAFEIKTPLDLEQSISLPRGNIFHRDLSFPFREEGSEPSWGVETNDPRIFICGAGAVRGGGVSGIPGHNAAMALLANN